MSISVNGLVKNYGHQQVLKNISFEIEGAGVTGFLGPNGAGKSTLMKILSCSITPTSGYAEINGINVLERPLDVKKLIGYLPEHNPLYLDMYVREYLNMVADVYKVKKKKKIIEDAIGRTGLSPESKKKIGALSKGYRQRVGLAHNLLHNPSVLILDEPTTGLDPNQILEIRSLIKDLGKDKTVILSSHIMQEVEAMCERVIIIKKGDLVADDKTKILKHNTSDFYVEVEFLNTIEPEYLRKIDYIASYENIYHNTYIFKGSGNKDFRADLFNWASENNHVIIAMQKKENRLEDVFRNLTQE